jgi:uncharacterized protein YvpB
LCNRGIFPGLLLIVLVAGCSTVQAASILEQPTLASMTKTVTSTGLPMSLPEVFTPTPTPQPSFTPTLTPSLTVTLIPPTSTPLPTEFIIRNIRGHRQYFPIGCETAAAVDWAAFHKMTLLEYNFQLELPVSDNPDFGFVGDVKGPWGQVPPYAYGVYAGPVAQVLQHHGLPARAIKGATIEDLKVQVSSGHPVIVWVIGNVVGGIPATYTDSKGNKTIVAAYEHVVIVTGYSKTTLRYMNNGKFYDVPINVFENSWKVLGNMAIVWDNTLMPMLPKPTTTP